MCERSIPSLAQSALRSAEKCPKYTHISLEIQSKIYPTCYKIVSYYTGSLP